MFNKKITADELKQLNLLWSIAYTEAFKLEVIKKNTGFIEKGQELAKQLEGLAPLFGREFQDYIKSLLVQYGFKANEAGTIDLRTGVIKKLHDIN